MCGLSQFISTQIGTDLALWYVVNSGFLNNPVESDTFRFHLYTMEHLVKLVKLLGYPIHECFEKHYLRTRALYYFMDRYKRSSKNEKKSMKNLFKGLYQRGFLVDISKLDKKFNSIEICTEFIPVDGAAD